MTNRSLSLYSLKCCLLTLLIAGVGAQRFDFQYYPSAKNTFCAMETARRNGSTSLVKALEGQTVSVLYDVRDAEVDADVETGEISGGYFVDIMRQAAKIGGFELLEEVSPGLPEQFDNWTVYMHWGVDNYDIFSDWWAVTGETLDQDIVFSFGFLEMSKILVVQEPEMQSSPFERAFSFLEPFHVNLWITVVAASIFAGFIFLLLERGHNEFDIDLEQTSLVYACFHSIWLSFIMLTGAGAFMPRTPQGKLFTFLWSFLVLLLVAAYTANLASYMVQRSQPTSEVKSLEDASNLGTRLCIPDLYDEVFIRLQRQYPSLLADSVKIEWGGPYFDFIRSGACDAVLMTVFEWEAMQGQREHNGDCDMLYPGRPFWTGGGGFPIRRDSSTHCTSFLNEVLGAIMAQMDNDGTLEGYYATYLKRKEQVTCSAAVSEVDNQLKVENMIGGFGCFAVVCALIVVWTFVVDRRSIHLSKLPTRDDNPAAGFESRRPTKPSAVATAPRLPPRSMSQRLLQGGLANGASFRAPAAVHSSAKVWDSSCAAASGEWVEVKQGEEGSVMQMLQNQRQSIDTVEKKMETVLQQHADGEQRMQEMLTQISRTAELLEQLQRRGPGQQAWQA